MLRACVLDFGGSWEDHIPLVEFSYNNNFQPSIGMAHMRLFMAGNVDLQFVRMMWVRGNFWVRICSSKYRKNSANMGKVENNTKSTKKLCTQLEVRIRISSGLSCLPKGIAEEKCNEIWEERKA